MLNSSSLRQGTFDCSGMLLIVEAFNLSCNPHNFLPSNLQLFKAQVLCVRIGKRCPTECHDFVIVFFTFLLQKVSTVQ